MSRRIVDTIVHVTSAAKRYAAGDLSVSVDVRDKNEIGDLGHATNLMADSLRSVLAPCSAAPPCSRTPRASCRR